MIIRSFYTLLILITIPLIVQSKEIVLDKIIMRVNGKNILKSDLEQPRITKNVDRYTLKELITDEILVQRAEELNCIPTASNIDSSINAEKIELGGHNMSDAAFEKERLRGVGLTLPIYRKQLYRFHCTEYLLNRVITSKLIIPTQDIEEYYEKNPIYTEEKFHILLANAQNAQAPTAIRWIDFGWFTLDQLDEVYRDAVVKLKPGQATSEPINKDGVLQFIMLKEHKERLKKTFSARYSEIKHQLREERREPFVKNFVQDLETKAYITFP